MAGINYLYRRAGRYYFRRRLYLRTIINCPIMIAMGTADPVQARRLVARLPVIWDETIMTAREQGIRGHLNATEAVALFKSALNEELGLATAGRHDVNNDNDRTNRVLAATYRVAAQLDPEAISVSDGLLDVYTRDFSEADRRAVVLMLKGAGPHRSAPSEAEQALNLINAPVNRATIREAAIQILLAKAEAQSRAGLLAHPLATVVGEPLSRLIDDDAVAAMRDMDNSATKVSVPEPKEINDTPYLTMETQRFSDIIDATITAIQSSGDWNEDIAQRKTAMRAFAWITGDKRLCDYRPADAQKYAQTLDHLPISFRWGTPEKGSLSRPFTDVMVEIPKAKGSNKRSKRTLNRDLTIMSRVARELEKVAWKPKFGVAPVMNFNAFSATVVEDPNDPDRMPWTEESLRACFSSPVYMGGGGCSNRYQIPSTGRIVYQDAAYWVPLLLVYTLVAREEACGVECLDFVFDAKTPYLVIRANMTRSKDGENPGGLKRASRFRMIPIHPELLRLGLQRYVEHIVKEGHTMAFPELYQAGHVKQGGARFYARAGRHLLDYVDRVKPLLRTRKGKRADLHSMRTSGASALEFSDAKQLQVDDIMGHAREGTGPRKYSKASHVKRDEILAQRLELMISAIPNVTSHLKAAPLRLLPLHRRSQTGSPNSRGKQLKD